MKELIKYPMCSTLSVTHRCTTQPRLLVLNIACFALVRAICAECFGGHLHVIHFNKYIILMSTNVLGFRGCYRALVQSPIRALCTSSSLIGIGLAGGGWVSNVPARLHNHVNRTYLRAHRVEWRPTNRRQLIPLDLYHTDRHTSKQPNTDNSVTNTHLMMMMMITYAL